MAQPTSESNMVKDILERYDFFDSDKTIYMRSKKHPEEGVVELTLETLGSIMVRIKKGPCSMGSKEAVFTMIKEKLPKVAKQEQIFVRTGCKDGSVLLDLGRNGVMEVNEDKIVHHKISTALFVKTDTMMDLPIPKIPKDGEKLLIRKELAKILNIPWEELKLAVAFLMSAFCQEGTKPILIMAGLQKSAKSMSTRNLVNLIDPQNTSISGLPRTEIDLFIAAGNKKIAPFDNVSEIPIKISDAACRIANRGSLIVRKYYTNGDVYVHKAHASLIFNGIDFGELRGDLLDRALKITLPQLNSRNTLLEAEITAKFNEAHPKILGYLLKAVQYALRNPTPMPKEIEVERLTDFTQWSYQWAETFGWNPKKLVKLINQNQRALKMETLSVDSIAFIVMDLVNANGKKWEGTPTEFFVAFMDRADLHNIKHHSRPGSASALSSWLERTIPALEVAGLTVKRGRTSSERKIIITMK